MAIVIVTLKIMPQAPDTELKLIEQEAGVLIKAFGGTVGKIQIEEIAYGLKAIIFMFSMDEKLGGTDKLEQQTASIDGVNSAETVDVRRAIG